MERTRGRTRQARSTPTSDLGLSSSRREPNKDAPGRATGPPAAEPGASQWHGRASHTAPPPEAALGIPPKWVGGYDSWSASTS